MRSSSKNAKEFTVTNGDDFSSESEIAVDKIWVAQSVTQH